jgi:hypothetical protein
MSLFPVLSVASIDYIDHGWTRGLTYKNVTTAGGILPKTVAFYCDMEIL